VRDEVRTQLKEAAEVCREAPSTLLAAILKAADDGDTSTDIAKAINFYYSPDYVRKLIRQHRGARKGGRRPRPRPGDN
jgi:hypothetical protein